MLLHFKPWYLHYPGLETPATYLSVYCGVNTAPLSIGRGVNVGVLLTVLMHQALLKQKKTVIILSMR